MADLEIQYDPITVNGGPVTVTLAGLDNIKVDQTLSVPKPIETKSSLTLSIPDTVKTDSKLTYSFPDPIKTEAKAAIDLQPVVVDQCLRLSLGPLPPTLVCLPNRQRVGLTVFGVEVLGLTLEGEAKLVVQDLPHPAHVINLPAPHHQTHHEPHGAQAGHAEPASITPAKSPPFVVRLGG